MCVKERVLCLCCVCVYVCTCVRARARVCVPIITKKQTSKQPSQIHKKWDFQEHHKSNTIRHTLRKAYRDNEQQNILRICKMIIVSQYLLHWRTDYCNMYISLVTEFWYFHQTLEVDCVWNVKAHAQKPDFVFRRKGRVHLNRQGRQFSRLLAAEVCASAVVMLDTPSSVVVWRVLATHSIRQFPLTSSRMCHRVPSRFNSTLTVFLISFVSITIKEATQIQNTSS